MILWFLVFVSAVVVAVYCCVVVLRFLVLVSAVVVVYCCVFVRWFYSF